MFKAKPFCLLLVLFFAAAETAWSQASNPVGVQTLGYGGPGCPAGSVVSSISPDSSALSLLFSQYAFDVRQGAQDRRGCTLQVQVTPPVGYQLKVLSIDYRGFAALSAGARARLTTQVVQQHEGESRALSRSSQDYVGVMNDVFSFSTGSNAGTWTNCGGRPVVFNLNSSLEVVNRSNDLATVSIDSADASLGAGATFYLAWSKCIDGKPDPHHGGGGPTDHRGDHKGDNRGDNNGENRGDHGAGNRVDRNRQGDGERNMRPRSR